MVIGLTSVAKGIDIGAAGTGRVGVAESKVL